MEDGRITAANHKAKESRQRTNQAAVNSEARPATSRHTHEVQPLEAPNTDGASLTVAHGKMRGSAGTHRLDNGPSLVKLLTITCSHRAHTPRHLQWLTTGRKEKE